MSEENIENITKSDSLLRLMLIIISDITFNRRYLTNNIYIPKKVIKLYNSFTLTPWFVNLNIDFTLNNCLFGYVKLTMNIDPGNGRAFDFRSEFLLQMEAWAEISLFFGVDMSSSENLDNKNKDKLIFGE